MFSRFVFFLFVFWGSMAQAAESQRVLIDMAGASVAVPQHVERVVTVGPIPVLNSLIFAVGAGQRIANGLGVFARQPRWRYQTVFAPQIATLPALQNANYTPDIEALLKSAPDAVLTMDRVSAERLRRAGLPALYLAWSQPEEVKTVVRLLGQLFSRPEAAERYAERFDSILSGVAARLRQGALTRPRVLYFTPATLTQPHLIAEWWIPAAGGVSVTDDGRSVESRSFTMEQLLFWNPEILIVASRKEAETVLHEPRFASLAAVRAKQVLVAPCGAHTWANRTSEQPLTVLWAAQRFHPALFANLDVTKETQRFYRDIFGVTLSVAQVEEILAGGPRTAPAVPARN